MADPPAAKGDGKIAGVDKRTAIIIALVAVGAGLLYFYVKSKSGSSSGTGTAAPAAAKSPTGVTREHIVVHVKDHGGHK